MKLLTLGDEMALKVTKVGEDCYLATASPLNVSQDWETKEALTARQLVEELFRKGAHQTDIGDALHDANREWLDRGGPPPSDK